ncbi:CPBP family intramembrane glutamic endopeptidase [Caviibacter abscessus]|uniref:CPBP family intramembrane glutamic endopeptidase n=1 Tax=Caviibacter abscessus TaxID=1766719 RepID=UPI00082E9682|nr:CPBP family intramembrane glutamic endopeptidase [Caviibacter abscessus]
MKNISEERKSISIYEIAFFFALCCVVTLVLSNILEPIFHYFKLIEDTSLYSDASTSISLVVYTVIIGSIFEEMLYRGFLLRKLEKYGPFFAVITSSIFFGTTHQNIYQVFVIAIASTIIGYVAYKYSFKIAVLLHIMNNLNVEINSQLANINASYSTYYQYALFVLSLIITIKYKDIIKNINILDRFKHEKESFKTFFTRIPVLILLSHDIFFTIISAF